jgi:hypothetical protein
MSENNVENIVPLFKSFEELKSDEEQILKDFAGEWEAAYVTFDERQPAVALAKVNAGNDCLKSADALLVKRNSIISLVNDLKAAVEKRNGRLFGFDELAKRSYRFATAQRRNYGAAATILSIEAKKNV